MIIYKNEDYGAYILWLMIHSIKLWKRVIVMIKVTQLNGTIGPM
jgi:hypothetical protein